MTSKSAPVYHYQSNITFGEATLHAALCDRIKSELDRSTVESVMAESTPPSSVKVYYEKGKFFRVIHVDGGVGSITPSRNIFLSLYNQRNPLPAMIEQRLSPDGKLGVEIAREGKTGVFREMEIGIVLTATTAREIAKFLLEQAKLLEESFPIPADNPLRQP